MDDPPPLQHTRVLTLDLARSLQPDLELGDLDNLHAEVLEKILTAIAPRSTVRVALQDRAIALERRRTPTHLAIP